MAMLSFTFVIRPLTLPEGSRGISAPTWELGVPAAAARWQGAADR